ncbi:MAG: hypothetical protein HY288_14160 [Planctomycetia bacterium]|nr:hypothetical protein [Planctomycetia bacterium]
MSHGDPKSQATLGFLTVLEHEQQGLVGGYLILNPSGRPLEFHCTAPIKPNRAQQILFGPTLQSYLYGEQIGQTLLSKGSLEPLAVCTDVELALSVRDYVALPVALVLGSDEKPDAAVTNPQTSTWRVDAPHRPGLHLNHFTVGRNRLAVAADRDADRQTIAGRLESLEGFDLSEPFERIREAVEEAHKGGRA